MREVWKPIKGYEGLYEVSNFGHIRGLKRGRLLRPGEDGNGYRYVNLCKNGKVKNTKVAKIVAETFLGPKPKGMTINHKDLDKSNNHAYNLEYVTLKENIRHALRLGSKDPKNLDEMYIKVREYMDTHDDHVPFTKIAEDLGISVYYVRRIARAEFLSQTTSPMISTNERYSRLSDDDVQNILHLITQGVKQQDIADQFDIDPSLVTYIKQGKRYKHITNGANDAV